MKMTMVEEKKKVCTCCTVEKVLSHFPKDGKAPDGRRTICKVCVHKPKKVETIHELIARVKSERTWVPPIIDISCDYDDYMQTSLVRNWNFISGDGGYQNHINKLRESRTNA